MKKSPIHPEVARAIELRNKKQGEEALTILLGLLVSIPDDPDVNYQIAWTQDTLGNEGEAVRYYEKAIKNGLKGDDRKGALLGLGSTHRCLGNYEKSLEIFDQAICEFPEDRAFKVFRSLTYYNLSRAEDAVRDLLVLLLDTTNDSNIKTYDRALRFYSDKLKEKWK